MVNNRKAESGGFSCTGVSQTNQVVGFIQELRNHEFLNWRWGFKAHISYRELELRAESKIIKFQKVILGTPVQTGACISIVVITIYIPL